MAKRPKAPKPIPISTRKAVAACHAVGLTYHGRAGALLAAVDDRQGYHSVRVRTSKGVTQAAHACRSQRSALASKLSSLAVNAIPMDSREYTAIELALVNPSWLCDIDGDFVDVVLTDDVMVAAGLDFSTVEDDQ